MRLRAQRWPGGASPPRSPLAAPHLAAGRPGPAGSMAAARRVRQEGTLWPISFRIRRIPEGCVGLSPPAVSCIVGKSRGKRESTRGGGVFEGPPPLSCHPAGSGPSPPLPHPLPRPPGSAARAATAPRRRGSEPAAARAPAAPGPGRGRPTASAPRGGSPSQPPAAPLFPGKVCLLGVPLLSWVCSMPPFGFPTPTFFGGRWICGLHIRIRIPPSGRMGLGPGGRGLGPGKPEWDGPGARGVLPEGAAPPPGGQPKRQPAEP